MSIARYLAACEIFASVGLFLAPYGYEHYEGLGSDGDFSPSFFAIPQSESALIYGVNTGASCTVMNGRTWRELLDSVSGTN